jgi:hypothetical protein
MRPRCLALLAAIALSGGLSGCGSDDELSSDIPRTSPDLTIPTATTEITPDPSSTTTSTTTTSTTPGATAPPAGGVTPPPVAAPPVAPPPASTTGGASPQTGTGQPTTGGAGAGDPDFQNFCRDNPGAGPPC